MEWIVRVGKNPVTLQGKPLTVQFDLDMNGAPAGLPEGLLRRAGLRVGGGATVMQLPARIGKYELQEFLGGGMSHVYRARDTVIGRTVAVKILTEAGCADADAKARFLAEARMAGNLAHDNIIGIYDFGEDEQRRPFMVMEFLRGEDLRHAIQERRHRRPAQPPEHRAPDRPRARVHPRARRSSIATSSRRTSTSPPTAR